MPKIINPSTIVKNWLKEFGSALEKKDVQKTINLFDDECFWRDLVSFTWNIKTMEGKEQIADVSVVQAGSGGLGIVNDV